MADFLTAYKHTALNEGGWVNDPRDKGAETIYGISRKYWPKWKGWAIIDAIKEQYGTTAKIINQHAGSNQVVQTLVSEFYKVNFWYPLNLQLINDQQLAKNVYDFGVNAGTDTAAKKLQAAANSICGSLVVDGQIGSKTVAAINNLNAESVYNAFNNQRKAYYDRVIANNPSQYVFRKSWYSRIIPYQA